MLRSARCWTRSVSIRALVTLCIALLAVTRSVEGQVQADQWEWQRVGYGTAIRLWVSDTIYVEGNFEEANARWLEYRTCPVNVRLCLYTAQTPYPAIRFAQVYRGDRSQAGRWVGRGVGVAVGAGVGALAFRTRGTIVMGLAGYWAGGFFGEMVGMGYEIWRPVPGSQPAPRRGVELRCRKNPCTAETVGS